MTTSKVWRIGVIVAVLVIGGYFYQQGREEEFVIITDEGEMTQFIMTHSQEELDAYRLKVDEVKAQDTFGGETPEETLAMFIEALKAGDMELASKYFVLEKQGEILNKLTAGSENGGVDKLLGVLSRVEEGGFYGDNKESFNFVVVGNEGEWKGVVEFMYSLSLNNKSELWKLENI